MHLKFFSGVISILLGSLGGFSSTVVWAGVYRCVGETGVVEFRDKPCQSTAEAQDFLPYVYEPSNEKIIQQKEKALEHTKERLAVQARKQARAQARESKAAEEALLKAERRAARCTRTQEKIKEIEALLREGSKVRRFNRLKTQLSELERLKHRYCDPI